MGKVPEEGFTVWPLVVVLLVVPVVVVAAVFVVVAVVVVVLVVVVEAVAVRGTRAFKPSEAGCPVR